VHTLGDRTSRSVVDGGARVPEVLTAEIALRSYCFFVSGGL
jgi:hypothetical protein